mgnify:FL=1
MDKLLSLISTAHVVQAVIIGAVLAFLTAIIIINIKIKAIQTTVNGWSTSLICGRPDNGILARAASSKFLPLVNIAEEAMYWTTTRDHTKKPLSGRHKYVLHFPAGRLPPNDAFWSLTITDTQGYMVGNSVDRHSLGDRSGLVENSDRSIDLYIQRASPPQGETNWLPALAGNFKLMLRVYLPGQAALEGKYQVPPVMRVQ